MSDEKRNDLAWITDTGIDLHVLEWRNDEC